MPPSPGRALATEGRRARGHAWSRSRRGAAPSPRGQRSRGVRRTAPEHLGAPGAMRGGVPAPGDRRPVRARRTRTPFAPGGPGPREASRSTRCPRARWRGFPGAARAGRAAAHAAGRSLGAWRSGPAAYVAVCARGGRRVVSSRLPWTLEPARWLPPRARAVAIAVYAVVSTVSTRRRGHARTGRRRSRAAGVADERGGAQRPRTYVVRRAKRSGHAARTGAAVPAHPAPRGLDANRCRAAALQARLFRARSRPLLIVLSRCRRPAASGRRRRRRAGSRALGDPVEPAKATSSSSAGRATGARSPPPPSS